MEYQFIIYLIIAIIITSLSWLVYVTKLKSNYANLQSKLQNTKSELSVHVSPYKREYAQGDDGWFINDEYHEVQLGYQQQLFLNGIPLLEPSIIIEDVLIEEKKEVDYKKVNNAMEAIESRLETIIANSEGLVKLVSQLQ